MKTFLVAIPNPKVIKKVFELRKKIAKLGYGSIDPRANVLPHITVTYVEDENLSKEQVELIINKLSKLYFQYHITLKVKKLLNWEHKIVASFDTKLIRELVLTSQTLFEGIGIKVNTNYRKLYGDAIGDHMKIVRQVIPEKIQAAIDLVKSEFPKEITLDRIAFIGYDCREKDILWQKKLVI